MRNDRGKYKETSVPADAFDVAEFKAFALIADTDFDAIKIPFHLAQAQADFEDLTSHLTTNRDFEITIDNRFPVSGEIELMRLPLGSVSSVSYHDAVNVSQTLAASRYEVDYRSEPPRIVRASGESWPETYLKPNTITVSGSGGYGSLYSDVPKKIRHAIYSIARDRFNRLPILDKDTLDQIEGLRWKVIQ